MTLTSPSLSYLPTTSAILPETPFSHSRQLLFACFALFCSVPTIFTQGVSGIQIWAGQWNWLTRGCLHNWKGWPLLPQDPLDANSSVGKSWACEPLHNSWLLLRAPVLCRPSVAAIVPMRSGLNCLCHTQKIVSNSPFLYLLALTFLSMYFSPVFPEPSREWYKCPALWAEHSAGTYS